MDDVVIETEPTHYGLFYASQFAIRKIYLFIVTQNLGFEFDQDLCEFVLVGNAA